MKKKLLFIVCLAFLTVVSKAQNQTLVKDLTLGSGSTFDNLNDDIIGHIGDKVLFTVYDASSIGHLYVSDGTDEGTIELHHLTTLDESYTTFLKYDATTIAFVVYNQSTIKYNLFVTNGSTVTILNKHSEDLSVDNLHAFANGLFYTSDDKSLHRIEVDNSSDDLLYVAPRPFVDFYFDGVQNGYFAVKGAQGDTLYLHNMLTSATGPMGFIGNSSELNVNFQRLGSKVLFFIKMAGNTYGLYAINGTTMQLIKTFAWGGSNHKKYFIIKDNQLFFDASLPLSDPDFNGYQLWVTDGTTGGTVALSNINIPFDFVSYSALYNDRLYFPTAENGTVDTYFHLYSTDGTVNNTHVEFADALVQTSIFGKLVSGSGKLYAAGYSIYTSSDKDIWEIGSSSIVLYGIAETYSRSLYATDTKFFYIGNESSTGYELYKFDPQSGGIYTAIVNDQKNSDLFYSYPNPVSDQLSIEYKGTDQILAMQLRDLSGKNVRNFGNEKVLNVGSLAAGIYFLEVELKNSKQVIKIIKK
ncbi:MAG: hypothetical protein JWM14_1405 [Chitinophagaceae bacterium]|nr:hypothetical protein [Chitinophagaceae bacterium]